MTNPATAQATALHALRWLLTIPAALAAWYIGLNATLLIYKAGDWMCAPEDKLSGVCFAAWFAYVPNVALGIGALLSGALTVVLPTLIAPEARQRVATVAFAFGALASLLWQLSGLWTPVFCCLLGSGFAWWCVRVMLADSGAAAK